MHKVKTLLVSLIAIFGMFVSSTTNVFAADNPADYSVSPVMPSNQKKGITGYYDLIVKAGQEQTLTLKIKNGSKSKTTFEVYANPAMTSDGGAIDYANRQGSADKTVPFDFRKAVTLEKNEYTVPAGATLGIPVKVKIPNLNWRGRVIGGINIQKKGAGSQTRQQGNASIKTKIAYSVAVVLQEKQEKLTPDLKYVSTKPAQIDGYTTIQETLQNPTATIISDVIFTSVIYKDGKKFINNTSNKYTIAPNSKFHVNIGLDGQPVQAGKYKIDVTAKSGSFYKWHFTDSFEITANEAEKVNKNAIFPQKPGPNIWMIVAIVAVVIFLIALIAFLILWNRRKRKKVKNKKDVKSVNVVTSNYERLR